MNSQSPLPHCRLLPGASLAKTRPWASGPVTLDSPASAVMTDLTQIKAATIAPCASLREASHHMAYLGVHMLFAVSEMPSLDGLITSTDLNGERPLQVVRQRGGSYDDLAVSDIMTPLAQIDAVDMAALEGARVSNVIASLKLRGRNHMLVVDTAPGIAMRVRGVISRSQVERQLGARIELAESANCFADLVKVLA